MNKKLLFIILVIIVLGAMYYLNSPSYALTKYIDDMTSKKDEVINAILDIRIARSRIKLHCRARPEDIQDNVFLQKCDQDMDTARVGLVNAKSSVAQFFPQYIVSFVQDIYNWDISFTSYDLCAWAAPTDEEYRRKQETLEKSMQKVIDSKSEGS